MEQLLQIIGLLSSLPDQIGKQLIAVVPPRTDRRAVSSSTQEKQRVVTTKKGLLFDVWMSNQSAVDLYLLLVDKSSDLARNGDLPVIQVLIPAGASGYLTWPNGRPFQQGIIAVASSTANVVTLHTANECWFDAVIEA